MGFGRITELTVGECWQLLHSCDLGRIAVSAAGSVDIFPISYAVGDAGAIYFRSAPGAKLLELALNDRVAFEVDGHHDDEAWSVVVKGRAERVERTSEKDAAERLGLAPWIPTMPYRWLRIQPIEIWGRRFARDPEPSRA